MILDSVLTYMTPARFRFLLLLSTLLAFAVGAEDTLMQQDASFLRLWEAYEARSNVIGVYLLYAALLLAVASAFIASLVGLYRFRRWGRTWSLWLTLASQSVFFLVGPMVAEPLDWFLYTLSNMLWGAVLAVAYFSPLSARFEGTPDLR